MHNPFLNFEFLMKARKKNKKNKTIRRLKLMRSEEKEIKKTTCYLLSQSVSDVMIAYLGFFLDKNDVINFYICSKTSKKLAFGTRTYFFQQKNKDDKNIFLYNTITQGTISHIERLIETGFLNVNSKIIDELPIYIALKYSPHPTFELLFNYTQEPKENLLKLSLELNALNKTKFLLTKVPEFKDFPIGHMYGQTSKKPGMSLLMQTVMTKNRSLLKKVLSTEHLKEININNGVTSPLFLAIALLDLPMVKLLVEKGADISQTINNSNALDAFLTTYVYSPCIGGNEPLSFMQTMEFINCLHRPEIPIEKTPHCSENWIVSILTQNYFSLSRALISADKTVAKHISLQLINSKMYPIAQEAEKNNDWDMLNFWMKFLKEKSKDFFSATHLSRRRTFSDLSEEKSEYALHPSSNSPDSPVMSGLLNFNFLSSSQPASNIQEHNNSSPRLLGS